MSLRDDSKPDTILTHAGRDPHNNHGVVNPPVYHASTILFPTLDALDNKASAKVVYGRRGTPTSFALIEAICALEGGHGGVICSSGLAAISVAMTAVLKTGDHVLLTDSAYLPTRQFADRVLRRFGVEVSYYDPRIGAGIDGLIRANTRLIWMESPGSQTFEVQDIPAIVGIARARGIVTAIDNTWGAGYYLKPLAMGVDISVQAATKYIVGHSDTMLGTVVTNEALYPVIQAEWDNFGGCAGPDDIYLATRGLRTMGVRLRQHYAAALKVAHFLEARPEVTQVMHPALESSPDHAIWKRDFTGACGLFGFVLKAAPRAALADLLDHLRFFGMGYSWGGFESLLIPTDPAHIRTATRWDVPGQAMRIHIGLEDVDDLMEDLACGLDRYGRHI